MGNQRVRSKNSKEKFHKHLSYAYTLLNCINLNLSVMKNKNVSKSFLLISLAIIMLIIGKPEVCNAQWGADPIQKTESSNTGWILAGVAVTLAVAVIVVIIVKKNKKKKNLSNNLQFYPENYSMTSMHLPNWTKTAAELSGNISAGGIGQQRISFMKSSFSYRKAVFLHKIVCKKNCSPLIAKY